MSNSRLLYAAMHLYFRNILVIILYGCIHGVLMCFQLPRIGISWRIGVDDAAVELHLS